MQSGGREPAWGQRLLQPGERPGQRELGQAVAGWRPGDTWGSGGRPLPGGGVRDAPLGAVNPWPEPRGSELGRRCGWAPRAQGPAAASGGNKTET